LAWTVPPQAFDGGVTVTLDHHGLAPRPAAALSERGLDDPDRLALWWSRLSAPARSAFAADPDGPISTEFLDEVMVGGVRIVGYLAGGQPMQWRFAAQARDFIAHQGAGPTA
jgi:hypothetical protein